MSVRPPPGMPFFVGMLHFHQAAKNASIDGATNFSDASANLAALPRATAAPGDDGPRD